MKKIIVILAMLCLGSLFCSCSANMSFPTDKTSDISRNFDNQDNSEDYTVYETDNNGVESYDYHADRNGRVRGFISDHNR